MSDGIHDRIYSLTGLCGAPSRWLALCCTEEQRTGLRGSGSWARECHGELMHFPRASHLTEREMHPGRSAKDTFHLGREAKDL